MLQGLDEPRLESAGALRDSVRLNSVLRQFDLRDGKVACGHFPCTEAEGFAFLAQFDAVGRRASLHRVRVAEAHPDPPVSSCQGWPAAGNGEDRKPVRLWSRGMLARALRTTDADEGSRERPETPGAIFRRFRSCSAAPTPGPVRSSPMNYVRNLARPCADDGEMIRFVSSGSWSW